MALSDFDLVFFGGSGDLAMRKLLPAMYARDVANDLPPTARIICVGREEHVAGSLPAHGRDELEAAHQGKRRRAAWQEFLNRITYVAVDAGNVADLRRPGRGAAQGRRR